MVVPDSTECCWSDRPLVATAAFTAELMNLAWMGLEAPGRLRTACVMVAMLVLALPGHSGASASAELRADRGLLCDTEGTMENVVCVVNSARRALLHNAALATEILNGLPDRIRFTLLTNDREAFTLAKERSPGRVRFVDLPPDAEFTIWPQDPFLVLDEAGNSTLLQSAAFSRADDHRLTETLASTLGLPRRISRLAFQGGNLVANSRHVFVGAGTIRLNAIRLGVSDEAAVRLFERELAKPVLVLGPFPQPVRHIDLIVTPVGRDRVLVADARWGVRVARSILVDRADTTRQFEQEILDKLNAWQNLSGSDGSTGPWHPPSLAGAIEASEHLAPHLDGVAAGLAARGYLVDRVPFLGSPMRAEDSRPLSGTDPSDSAPLQRPGFPILTYNNVLLEEFEESTRVYLPQYGLEGFDEEGRDAWEALGCTVVPLKGFLASAMHGGSLRCCVKVLHRNPAR